MVRNIRGVKFEYYVIVYIYIEISLLLCQEFFEKYFLFDKDL